MKEKIVQVRKIKGSVDPADVCTKALGSVKIGEFEPKLHGYADL